MKPVKDAMEALLHGDEKWNQSVAEFAVDLRNLKEHSVICEKIMAQPWVRAVDSWPTIECFQ